MNFIWKIGFPMNIIIIIGSIALDNIKIAAKNNLNLIFFVVLLIIFLFFICYMEYLDRKYYLIELFNKKNQECWKNLLYNSFPGNIFIHVNWEKIG